MARRRRDRSSAPLRRRGVFLLPNLLTTGGLFCGFFSIVSTLRGDLFSAAVAIMAANVFDILDGRVARVTKSTSEFGSQYDSLSDLVAFGVAPGVLVYQWALQPWGTIGWLAACLYVTCGALRLARFNVQLHTASKSHFSGLAIPAAAEVIAASVLLYLYVFGDGVLMERSRAVVSAVCLVAGLMVSNIPYASFKTVGLHRRQPFSVLVGFVVMLVIFLAEPQVFLFSGAVLYAVSGPAGVLKRRWRQARGVADPAEPPSDLTGEKESTTVRPS